MQIKQSDDAAKARIARLEGYLLQDPENRHLLADMIELYLETDNAETARAFAERALAAHPHDLRLRLLAIDVTVAEGELEQADYALQAMLAEEPFEPAVAYQAVSIRFGQRRYQDAVDLFERYPAALGVDPDAFVIRAHCLHHLGDVKNALADAMSCLALKPDNTDAMGLAALLELDMDNEQRAEHWARAALAHAPDNLAALVTIGSIFLSKQNLREARAVFEHALSVKEDSGRAWLGMALVDMHETRLDEAVLALAKAVMYMPNHIGSWIIQGWAHLVRGEMFAAEGSFNHALTLDRNFSESHGSLAVILALQGKADEAGLAAQLGLRLDPNCASAQFAQALLLGQVNDARSLKEFAARLLQRSSLSR
jgi:tetratricopeptide (TPR) repeat protein